MYKTPHMSHAVRTHVIPQKHVDCAQEIHLSPKLDEIKASFVTAGGKQGFIIPDMPDVVQRLEQEIHKRYPNINVCVKIIESNTVIVGELLAIVKSPPYNRHVRRQIEVKSIENVVNLIGLPQTFRLVQAAAIKNIPQKTALFRSVIEHSSEVALACAEIAGYIYGVGIEEAYSFGLFRDSGAIVMSVSFNEAYDEHWERMKSFPISAMEKEHNYLGARHDYLGVVVARKWGFGDAPGDTDMMLAIQEHHNYEEVRCFSNEKVRVLVAIGLLAENLVNEIKGKTYIAAESDLVRDIAIKTLSLPDEFVSMIRKNLVSCFQSGVIL